MKKRLAFRHRTSILGLNHLLSPAAITEGIGTFILVFAGTGSVMVNQISNGAVTHLGISFVFGAVVAALIYTLGHISGAHFNPAVTLAFWKSGVFAQQKVAAYLIAQALGAIGASAFLRFSLGNVAQMGATLPLHGNWQQSFMLETVLTFILMFVILGSGLDRRASSDFAGLAIGLTVALEAACMGPITGASMNPVRLALHWSAAFGNITGYIGLHPLAAHNSRCWYMENCLIHPISEGSAMPTLNGLTSRIEHFGLPLVLMVLIAMASVGVRSQF
jgi:MIP family channel proteins